MFCVADCVADWRQDPAQVDFACQGPLKLPQLILSAKGLRPSVSYRDDGESGGPFRAADWLRGLP